MPRQAPQRPLGFCHLKEVSVIIAAVLLAGCASSSNNAAHSTGSLQTSTTTGSTLMSPASTSSTSGSPSTTTSWTATALSPSAYGASDLMLRAWADNKPSEALTDATPTAVHDLFAIPYPANGVDGRGCSLPPGGQPSICDFRISNRLLLLTVTDVQGGWEVTGVQVEG